MRLLITGATGYIGRRVARLALRRGHEVIAASRKRPHMEEYLWMPFELTSSEDFRVPSGVDAVIHLAADTSPHQESHDEKAARVLLRGTEKTRSVFVSSQTADAAAPTAYGRVKWRIEQLFLQAGGVVVRPGQVYGGQASGLFGTLVRTVRRLPVLPAVWPAPRVQPIHVDDLAEGLLRIAEKDKPTTGIVCLGAVEPISFGRFLAAIARYRVRRRRGWVPVPGALIRVAASAVAGRRQACASAARVASLLALKPMNTQSDLENLDLELRPWPHGMHSSGSDRRRRLLIEGRALLTYVLRAPPESILVRRYVKVVEELRRSIPMDLPAWSTRRPSSLALFDGYARLSCRFGQELSWRLNAATTLAEATPAGAQRFLGHRSALEKPKAAFWILRGLAGAAGWRILRLFAAPLVGRVGRKSML